MKFTIHQTGTKGLGVFAGQAHPPGQTLLQFKGPLLSKNEIPSPLVPENDHYLQIGPDAYLGPSGEVDDYINHSCDPNCGVTIRPNLVSLVSLKAIEGGAEITFDYATTSTEQLDTPCNCEGPLCRGRIGTFSDIPETLKRTYRTLGLIPSYVLTFYTASSVVARYLKR